MDFRERTFDSIKGIDVFPIPTDVFENGIYPILEKKILERFNLKRNSEDTILEKLNSHFRWGGPIYIGPHLKEGDFNFPPAYPCKNITRSIWGTWDGIGSYTGTIARPLESAETIQDIEKHKWPLSDWFDYRRLRHFDDDTNSFLESSKWANKYRNYVRVLGGFNPIFSRTMDLFGIEKGLINIAGNPNLIGAVVAHIGDYLKEYYTKLAESNYEYMDIIAFGDDFAGQNGMLLDPQMWKKYFLPIWKKLFGIAHKNNMKTMMHMCGSVRPVLGYLIDAGLDIYEVVQVTARDMEPDKLKKDFGKDLVFYGGVDVQQLLRKKNINEVLEEIKKIIKILEKGRKYILSSCHFLTDDIPVDNVLAMYNTIYLNK